jgi:hypothetical protein
MILRTSLAALRHARLALVLVLAGCAGLAEPLRSNIAADNREQRECAAWFHDLDAAVAQAGVGDGGEARIPGFPYLRVDRLLASFRHDAGGDPEVFAEWARRLAQLDANARSAEIANLPRFEALSLAAGGSAEVAERAQRCGNVLRHADLSDPARRALLVERATVPDDYSTAQRIFGFYALTRIPFYAGVMRWQDDA